MNKRLISSAILLKGFSAIVAQTLLIRELLIVFCGNELTFGIILSVWLAFGGLGGWLTGNLFKKSTEPIRFYALFQIIFSLWLPLSIVLVRTSKSWLGVSFAEVLNIHHIFLIALLCLSFLSFSDAGMFNIGFRVFQRISSSGGPSLGEVYFLESIGIIAGGITFTFVLLKICNSFQIAFLVSSLNLLCASLLLLNDRKHWLKAAIGLLLIVSLNAYSKSETLQKSTINQQWQNKNIIRYENSVYGNIAVSQEPKQYTVFYDGLPAISIPSPETYFTEDFIHLPLLLKPQSQKILFVGNAVGGLLREVFKYPVKEVFYAELDPLFIKTIQSLHEPTTQQELKDERLRIRFKDGRNFVKTTTQRFDVIFVNMGLPTSLAINRYDTHEFFKEVRGALQKDGIAVFKTWGSLAYLSEELKKINASLFVTLSSVFPYCEVIPGDGFNIFIASGQEIPLNPAILSENWTRLNLKASLINPEYIGLRLQKSYLEWFTASIKDELKMTPVNQDLKPTGLYDGLSLYYAQFSKKIPRLFGGFRKIKPAYLTWGIVIFLVSLRSLLPRRKIATSSLNFTVFSTGLFTMSIQIMVLLMFQSLLGYLFQWLAILTASFMAGSSLGALIAIKKIDRLTSYKKLAAMELFLPLLASVLLWVTTTLGSQVTRFPINIELCFSVTSLCAGFLVGIEVPLAYCLYAKQIKETEKKTGSKIAGQLYCLDLAGACIGAFVTPLILVPGCGIMATLLILGLIKITNSINISTLAFSTATKASHPKD